MSWIGMNRIVQLLKEINKLIKTEEEVGEIIVIEKASDFFKKLKESKDDLTIVKDPYKLVFFPYYMLWFEKDEITYSFFLPPDSNIWERIRYNFKISFPSEDGKWAQQVPYEEIKKFL